MEHVILVDMDDRPVGTMEKMEAHMKGLLHRAFSILLFNSKGELLLQKRSLNKYHSSGLWTNTCCSHPLPDESMSEATRRKLKQEMGIDASPEFAYKFIYRVELDNNLIEYELDHVFVGTYDGVPNANPGEVAEWRYTPMEALRQDAITNPQIYTHWFRLILNHSELIVPGSHRFNP